MQKPFALSLAVCLFFAGCQVFEKSPTWETVVSVRPGDSIRDPDPSASYAEKLHQALVEHGVEHYVVTYQYHYYTHQYDEAVSTRTAVVYRDNVNERYPWWVKDERTATPFWLPSGELDRQLSFYCQRKVEVSEKKFYPANGGSGKASVSLAQPQPEVHRAVAVEKPQPVTHIAQAKPHTVSPAKPVPASPSVPEKVTIASTSAQPIAVATTKPKTATAISTINRANSAWVAPTVLDPVQQTSGSAPRDEQLEKLFRQRNGTNYDRTSAVDRRKMEQLKHGLVGQETTGEQGFRRGVDGSQAY